MKQAFREAITITSRLGAEPRKDTGKAATGDFTERAEEGQKETVRSNNRQKLLEHSLKP